MALCLLGIVLAAYLLFMISGRNDTDSYAFVVLVFIYHFVLSIARILLTARYHLEMNSHACCILANYLAS